jgi:hypothetical protein
VWCVICATCSSRRKKINQVYLMAMLEMGIPKHKAEVALTETGNMGVEVATEWLFSTQDTTPFEQSHTTSDTGGEHVQGGLQQACMGAHWWGGLCLTPLAATALFCCGEGL